MHFAAYACRLSLENVTNSLLSTHSCNLQTLVLQSFKPNHLYSCILELLRPFAIDKVIGLSYTDETTLDPRSYDSICAGSQAGCANGAWLHRRVDVGVGQDSVDIR